MIMMTNFQLSSSHWSWLGCCSHHLASFKPRLSFQERSWSGEVSVPWWGRAGWEAFPSLPGSPLLCESWNEKCINIEFMSMQTFTKVNQMTKGIRELVSATSWSTQWELCLLIQYQHRNPTWITYLYLITFWHQWWLSWWSLPQWCGDR